MSDTASQKNRNAPIGVFDSGLGGLTVLRELLTLLPQESYVYLADTANAPYGRNSPETVRKNTLNNVEFFLHHEVKMIIFACNTSSAIALDAAKEKAGSLPVIGVIEAGISAAMNAADKERAVKIAVLATEATVANGVFARKIPAKFTENDYVEPLVRQKACQDFVQVVEDGKWDDPLADEAAEACLHEVRNEEPEIAILACTHFPLLKDSIQKSLPKTHLVDCSKALAYEIQDLLTSLDLLNTSKKNSELEVEFYVTKYKAGIEQNIGRILDIELDRVHHVDTNYTDEIEAN